MSNKNKEINKRNNNIKIKILYYEIKIIIKWVLCKLIINI